ncbi:MAG: nucleoside triphosphate pyrophosphohydrolase [Clostridia bacterium]|nr:nucleoside triphosphate pyrophosphohydrolase [Clostridia bacterium]
MGQIQVIGVGLEAGDLTLKAAEALKSGARVVLHTERIGCAAWLKEQGIAYEALDFLYDECEDFDEHAGRAAGLLMEYAGAGDVVYAVYDVRDRTVLRLSELDKKLRIIAGPPVEGALLGYLDGATRMLEASDWENFRLSAMDNALVRELNNRELASEVKLRLMECYPDETRCFVLNGDGSVARIPLYDLDRLKQYDHRSCALIFAERDLMKLERFSFDELVQVMRILQGPEGCPWDKAQTHESLRPFMLEETYEAIDCINQGDTDHLYDELGDILMQVVMHAEIARNHGEFDITDSITAICDKMIQRHTHIFGRDSAQDADSVLDLWTKNKMKERGQQTFTEVLREVSHSVPALMRGCKLIEKAARAGVNCADVQALIRDANAQLEMLDSDPEQALGNALLMLCALARSKKVDLEIALNEAADRFISRFAGLEEKCISAGQSLPAAPEKSAEYWDQVKL